MEHQLVADIFWGDISDKIDPVMLNGVTAETIFLQKPFNRLQQKFDLKQVLFLQQVHGVEGQIFTDQLSCKNFLLKKSKGDFLVTNCKKVGLGVLTADCLPLIFV